MQRTPNSLEASGEIKKGKCNHANWAAAKDGIDQHL